ncbi:hypothetical protein SUGI_1018520 [Cryptomeria japonica]|nr:hypothetical protein SUGI_1018520 [Cryptomeria japonica]
MGERRSNRGLWRPEEDVLLIKYIQAHGEGHWRTLPQRAGLQRCGKGCRLRWKNYLRPNVKRGNISLEEEELIIRLHKLLGNRWSLISGRVPGRTDTEIKNYWNTHLKKKLNCNNHHYNTAASQVVPPKINAQLECGKPMASLMGNSNCQNLCICEGDPSNSNFFNGNVSQCNYTVDNIVPQYDPHEIYLLNRTHFNTMDCQADIQNHVTYAYETHPHNVMDTSMASFTQCPFAEYNENNHGNQLDGVSLVLGEAETSLQRQEGFLCGENGFTFHEKPVQQYSSGEYVDGYKYLQELPKLTLMYDDLLPTLVDESTNEVGNGIQVGWNDNYWPLKQN